MRKGGTNPLLYILGGNARSASGSIDNLKTAGIYYSNSLTDLPSISGSSSAWYRVIVQGSIANIVSQRLSRNGVSTELFRVLMADGTTWG